MNYDRATGTVIYRSKMHLGLKRNFQVMPGAQWLELLCKHIKAATAASHRARAAFAFERAGADRRMDTP